VPEAWLNTAASAQQVKDQNHQGHNQHQMDQTSAHVQTETEKPH